MPYAVRNAEGQVTSLHRHDPGVGEELHAQHPDVRAFLGLDPGRGGQRKQADDAETNEHPWCSSPIPAPEST